MKVRIRAHAPYPRQLPELGRYRAAHHVPRETEVLERRVVPKPARYRAAHPPVLRQAQVHKRAHAAHVG